MTAEEFAQGLLSLCEKKIAINSEPILTVPQLASWIRMLLGHADPEVVRPPVSLQLPVPKMEPGEWLPGVGRYTGQGSTARPFDNLANELKGGK